MTGVINRVAVIAAFLAMIIILLAAMQQIDLVDIQAKELKKNLGEVQTEYDKLKADYNSLVTIKGQQEKEYRQSIEVLTEQVKSLRAELENRTFILDDNSRGGERPEKISMRCTTYTEQYEDCGKMPDDPEYGITASGEPVKEWYTVAAGKELPFGTVVYIPYFRDCPNGGVFVVEDRGGMIKTNCIDVYMKDINESRKFGCKRLDVYILREPA